MQHQIMHACHFGQDSDPYTDAPAKMLIVIMAYTACKECIEHEKLQMARCDNACASHIHVARAYCSSP